MVDEKRTADQRVSRDLAQQIRCVAIRVEGCVLSMDAPARHHHIIHWLNRRAESMVLHGEIEQGFFTATGKFIDRQHAARLCGREGELYSEDLW